MQAKRDCVVVATRNEHKLEELREILTAFELAALPPQVELPPEDGDTFVENALGKARAAVAFTGMPAIADDSGIVATALDGQPGVRSARFAGENASDAENLSLLLERLAGVPDRSVAYLCAMCFVAPDGTEFVSEGRCEGRFETEPRGLRGFGYDPGFVPVEIDDGRTMAELDPAEKHAISHRGRAARGLAQILEAQGH